MMAVKLDQQRAAFDLLKIGANPLLKDILGQAAINYLRSAESPIKSMLEDANKNWDLKLQLEAMQKLIAD